MGEARVEACSLARIARKHDSVLNVHIEWWAWHFVVCTGTPSPTAKQLNKIWWQYNDGSNSYNYSEGKRFCFGENSYHSVPVVDVVDDVRVWTVSVYRVRSKQRRADDWPMANWTNCTNCGTWRTVLWTIWLRLKWWLLAIILLWFDFSNRSLHSVSPPVGCIAMSTEWFFDCNRFWFRNREITRLNFGKYGCGHFNPVRSWRV